MFPFIEIRDWGNLPFSPFALTTSLIALSGQPSPGSSFYGRTSDSDYWTRARDVIIDAAPVAAREDKKSLKIKVEVRKFQISQCFILYLKTRAKNGGNGFL